MKTFTLFALFLFFCIFSSAKTYYVATNGNDANSGTSITSPWRTIAKINSIQFLPGDSILLRRGDHWREQLTIPSSGIAGNPITFAAYGSGPKPILNGADIMTGWVSAGPNLWVITSPNATSSRAMVIIAGQIYAEVPSLAGLTIPNRYFIDVAASPDKLYIYCIADPNTLVSEVSKRDFGIMANGYQARHHINITNIECRYAGSGGLVMDGQQGSNFGGYFTVDSCHFYANRQVGCMTRDGHDNDTFKNSTATYNGNGFYTWISDNNVMQNCSTAHTIHYKINPGFTDGGAFQNYKGKNWLVEHCYSEDDNDAIHIDAGGVSTNAIIRYNKVFNSKFGNPNTPCMGVGSLGAGATIQIYYNLIVNGASYAFESYTMNNGKVLVYNNTIVLKPGTGVDGCIFLKYGDNFDFKNNLIVREGLDNKTMMLVAQGGIPSADYNHYYQVPPGSYRFFYNGGYSYDLPSWASRTGQDVHGQTGDPKFVNIGNDWRLQSGSSVINKGTNLGLTRDILGNPIVGLPDIGAYEYTATSTNAIPNANAGPDQSITLPDNDVTLNGSGTDPDGTISSYLWSKISGPTSFQIANANTNTTAVSNLVEGVYKFELTLTDNAGGVDKDTVQVEVKAPANVLPAASAGTNQTLTLPTNTSLLNGSGTDSDGSIVGYAWTKLSGPTGFTLTNGNMADATVSNLVQGTYVFRLTVRDDDGASGYDDVQITVLAAPPPPNLAPIANSGTDLTVLLPVNETILQGEATDPDGTIADFTWTKVAGPSGVIIDSPDADDTEVANLIAGTYTFRLTVTDDDGAVDTDDVQVIVKAAAPPPNQAPVANSGNDVTITLPVNQVNLPGSGTDTDGTISKYAWTKISGPAAGTITTPALASTTITGLIQGSYTYRLTVTDDDGAVAFDDVEVVVKAALPPPNQAPVANSGNDVTITLPVNQVNLSGSGTDTDGTISKYAWTKISGPAAGTITTPAVATTTITGLIQGTYTYRLTVTDDDGAVAFDDVVVIVKAALPPPNQAPVANSGNDVTITLPVNQVNLSGSGTDTDGTISKYTWTKISGPAAGTVTTPALASTSVTGLIQGTYTYRLTVTDDDGAVASDDVVVIVKAALPPPNQAPVANSGNDVTITLPVNQVSLSGSGTDTDGTISKYTWTKISGPAAGTVTTPALASTTVTGLIQGTYTYRLTVTDDDGAVASDDVVVIVKAALPPPNQAPVANSGNDVTITLPVNQVSLSGSGTDTDGTISKYAWTKISGPAAGTVTTPALASTSVTGLIQGTYTYRLTVTDDDGAVAFDDVVVIVKAALPPPNQAPVANSGNDVTITLPVNQVNLPGSGTDTDGTISKYAWTKFRDLLRVQ